MKPPASFLHTMEEYVREAPRMSTVRKDQVQRISFLWVCVDGKIGAAK